MSDEAENLELLNHSEPSLAVETICPLMAKRNASSRLKILQQSQDLSQLSFVSSTHDFVSSTHD